MRVSVMDQAWRRCTFSDQGGEIRVLYRRNVPNIQVGAERFIIDEIHVQVEWGQKPYAVRFFVNARHLCTHAPRCFRIVRQSAYKKDLLPTISRLHLAVLPVCR